MNRLQNESSPYLQQHASNPVDWWPWSDEAFEKAVREQKPVLVSIGYSTCHWCHVMERESFVDPDVAEIMNTHFISIKVDREERPDVDQLYMDAIHALGVSGGWPLNCFVTPDRKPFYGGTYFPPVPKFGRPSWKQLLTHIARLFSEKRQVVEEQAEKLTDVIYRQNLVVKADMDDLDVPAAQAGSDTNKDIALQIYQALEAQFDRSEGGFGNPPKFPSTMALNYLLNFWYHTGESEALEHARFSIIKMIRGGIYDQLGGGFARYATDGKWLVPHFEKMLYDNALLIELMSTIYQITTSTEIERAIRETVGFVSRELTDSDFGFYSALDADSEGVEGKYYVWDAPEIDEALGDFATKFKAFYHVTEEGNWEGKNILHLRESLEAFAERNQMDAGEFGAHLSRAKDALMKIRESRVRPGLDTKKILSWNALMAAALFKAGLALGDNDLIGLANKNLSYLTSRHRAPDSEMLYRIVGEDKKIPGFLDDYAFFIRLLIIAYQVTHTRDMLQLAGRMTEYVRRHFLDKDGELFYFTQRGQTDVPVRKIEVYDGEIPSGNAVMAENLFRIGFMLGRQEYVQHAEHLWKLFKPRVRKHPRSFGYWANGILTATKGIDEIAVVGPGASQKARALQKVFLPGAIVMAAETSIDNLPLLKARVPVGDQVTYYYCRNYACQLPVTTIEELLKQIENRNP